MTNNPETKEPLRILVVDDIPTTCEALESALTQDGYLVHTAQSVNDALRVLEENRNRPHHQQYAIAIIDINLTQIATDRSGLVVLQASLKVPFLEPIILTGFPDHNVWSEAYEKGAYACLVKIEGDAHLTFIESLRHCVRAALRNRHHLQEIDRLLGVLGRAIGETKGESAVTSAQDIRFHAQELYRFLLRARGRIPSTVL